MFLDWHPQAYQWLLEQNYSQIVDLYEQAIETDPSITHNYGFLGLAQLLLNQEEAAQSVWLTPYFDADETQLQQWTQELSQILTREALRQETIDSKSTAWIIRGHLSELVPDDLDNFLKYIQHSLTLEHFNEALAERLSSIHDSNQIKLENIDPNLVISIIDSLVHIGNYRTNLLDFILFCLQFLAKHINVPELVTTWVGQTEIQSQELSSVIKIAQKYSEDFPDYQPLIFALANFFTVKEDHSNAIKYCLKYEELCKSLAEQVLGSYLVLRARMGCGVHNQELREKAIDHQILLKKFISCPPSEVDQQIVKMIATTTYFTPYLEDNPKHYRQLQNKIGEWCCQLIQNSSLARYQNGQVAEQPVRQRKSVKSIGEKIRIGYLSHSLKQHSVGWLCRWIFQYHQRDKFHISLYLTSESNNSFTQSWFVQQVDIAYSLEGISIADICNLIIDDQIDILIDLDSLTSDINLGVLASKPAPIQISWLGWDAPGFPTVDYFLADPYVLPEDAESYYCEKIYRLPHTYIAVDGFEVGIPSVRRDHLGIPADAVVYFSGQRGYKRHSEIMQLQLRIIKEVPNSYLMIKGVAEQSSTRAFLEELAELEGIDWGRLRFLPQVGRELEHRANLQIADIVLDTFPYNGATTTLETLWLGIPMVTLAGQQFASRNSYTFLKNVGIDAGIAWTMQEYLDWGIRLGRDLKLRNNIIQTLQASRHISPLWDSRSFVLEIEKAYQTMWMNHG